MEITDILLHRKPFLFVDTIEKADEKQIVGTYTYREDEFFFKGHFPQYPVVPGVLLIEFLAQVGGAGLGMTQVLAPGSLFVLGTVEKAKFRHQVRPGDTVRGEVENLRVSSHIIRQQGKVKIGDIICAEASWMCLLSGEGDR
ncbi:MAG: 3-hydroxyacyl-ACP dehydratase FabZ [Spirochaetia bacterium]|jgi:3-hydroxyacyl-[acyl-carrier-protein] dehydratase|nr:3-hydroxyacyl-ACP dehydratase FabZ [Spirochaetia bacterium]